MKTVVIGAGISGLATAYALRERDPDVDVQVLEASDRVGGKAFADRTQEGFLCESGVNAFLDNKPRTLELAHKLALEPVTSFDASRHRFVYSAGRLHELPASPPAFFKSNLLSVPGRLRIIGEMLVPRGGAADESLAQFATRRLGREAYEKLIDPMATGVFAGDASKLSLNACFPRIHEVEQQYRSLILGLIKLQAAARKQGRKDTPGPGPGGKLTSFVDGMSVMTDALAAALGERVKVSWPVEAISRVGERYVVHATGLPDIEAERVIVAAPAHAQATMLDALSPEIATLLAAIRYPSLAVVCFGYRRERVQHHLDGFGFLIPSSEQRKILGTLWDASIFPNRAPEGYALLRTMVGGARASELALLPEDQMVDLVRRELAATMGVDASPEFVRIYRHEQAIPQYAVGHSARLAEIDRVLQRFPNLILTGNAYRGVAWNDCIANAYALAERLV
ncbi:MAG: hypothetical protein AMJ69_06485 [Gammaproteobacteria bacterium SG8_47]|nr:MAG: hypothetical protein AMJ69_06485 [Gammaproteobacteria bacterium SG8_47]